MIDWLREPDNRVRAAMWLLWACVAGWPTTHVLMVVTHPPEASWVFHLLLALSWLSLIVAALGVVVTTDIRREQEQSA